MPRTPENPAPRSRIRARGHSICTLQLLATFRLARMPQTKPGSEGRDACLFTVPGSLHFLHCRKLSLIHAIFRFLHSRQGVKPRWEERLQRRQAFLFLLLPLNVTFSVETALHAFRSALGENRRLLVNGSGYLQAVKTLQSAAIEFGGLFFFLVCY